MTIKEQRVEKVCAWCDWDRDETKRLMERGIKVTHTICKKCLEQVVA